MKSIVDDTDDIGSRLAQLEEDKARARAGGAEIGTILPEGTWRKLIRQGAEKALGQLRPNCYVCYNTGSVPDPSDPRAGAMKPCPDCHNTCYNCGNNFDPLQPSCDSCGANVVPQVSAPVAHLCRSCTYVYYTPPQSRCPNCGTSP